ncbi:hypothetical protein [Streptacidiphilus jiangxiensis]|uniref:Antitoxin VbhA domain-containing protein n=1 Tax=Streptacidiphilus jiangxiensis TaxID=235985 RepID=A0A1H7UCJ3_STRJI|nr:hypothetical protein SAMN05414137_115214 [Streptacidiphilus jiangxiensis]
MSQPGMELEPDEADALRAWAADERARADSLAAALEQIAANGLPTVEECVAWEEIRELALARLDGRVP